VTEIRIPFQKKPPHNQPFGPAGTARRERELDPKPLITLRIQPRKGISLKFGAKVPSAGLKIRSGDDGFSVHDRVSWSRPPEAYERLAARLHDRRTRLCFTRADEVGGGVGKLIDPIEAAWRDGRPSLGMYAAGTWGSGFKPRSFSS